MNSALRNYLPCHKAVSYSSLYLFKDNMKVSKELEKRMINQRENRPELWQSWFHKHWFLLVVWANMYGAGVINLQIYIILNSMLDEGNTIFSGSLVFSFPELKGYIAKIFRVYCSFFLRDGVSYCLIFYYYYLCFQFKDIFI